jgi:hypothetical protein
MDTEKTTRNEMYQQWLDENVQVFPTPQKIKLSEFQVDWKTLSGSFNLTMDGISTKERINFRPEVSGKPTLFFPVYHAPYGIPTSYSSISITWETEYCILKQLKILLPRAGGHFLDGDEIKFEYWDLNRNKLDDSTLEGIKKKVTDPDLILEFDMSYDYKI